MSVYGHLELHTALSVRAAADVLAVAVDATLEHEGRSEHGDYWSIIAPTFSIHIFEELGELLTGEPRVWAAVQHEHPAQLHRLLDVLFRHVVEHTTWRIVATSEASGFAPRSRS